MGEKRPGHVPLRRKVLPTLADIEPLPDSSAYGTINLLISALILFGIPGYLLDRWLGTSFIVGVGLAVGMVFALTVAWFRYGTGRSPHSETVDDGQPKHGRTRYGSDEQRSETTTEEHG